MSFRYKGHEYEYALKPTLGEMVYVEKKIGADIEDMTGMARVLVGYFIAVRRGDMAAGRDLTGWETIANSTMDDFDDIVPPPADEPVAELPESEWPLDPKDDGIQTAPRYESVQLPNPGPLNGPDSGNTVEMSTSSSSQYISVSPPTL